MPSSLRVVARPAFANRSRNTYNAALYEALAARAVEVVEWSPESILAAADGDLVHVHWPESHLNHRRWLRAAPRSIGLLWTIAKARRRGARLVWTVHNLGAHDSRWRRTESAFWRAFLPMVDGWLALTDEAAAAAQRRWPRLQDRPHATAVHGHYRGHYPDEVGTDEARRRLGLPADVAVAAFVGRIKPYKGVTELCRIFRQLPGDDVRLLVAGRIEGEALRRAVLAGVGDDPRVVLHDGAVADDRLQDYLRAADLVVAPFHEILNSGSVLLALSFDRPVLVPATGSMPTLGEVVGSEWVRTYDGALTAAELAAAIAWARRPRREGPDLSSFDWAAVAEATEGLYRRVREGHGVANPNDRRR